MEKGLKYSKEYYENTIRFVRFFVGEWTNSNEEEAMQARERIKRKSEVSEPLRFCFALVYNDLIELGYIQPISKEEGPMFIEEAKRWCPALRRVRELVQVAKCIHVIGSHLQ